MSLELFIARRLYGTRKGTRRISRPAVTIAQWGVAIGAVVMFVSICIIVGFKSQVRDKVIGFGGHIQVMNAEMDSNGPEATTAGKGMLDEIKSLEGVGQAEPIVQKPGMIVNDGEYEGIVLKGVGEGYDLSFIRDNLVEGTLPQMCDTASTNSIVISKNIADRLECGINDRILIYFMHNGIKARKMTVTGIYRTHLNELDNIMAITDIYTTRRLYGWENEKASCIEITINDYSKLPVMQEKINTIATRHGSLNNETIYTPTIEELYPSLFAWLEVLDQTVWLILILVLCISAFTMISGLLILILEKSSFIGIMKAIGAKNISIRKVFIYYSSFIIGKGLLIGNILGIILCVVQQQSGIIILDPEMYYMDKVPIEFNWLLLPMNIIMFILSVAIMVVPSMLISRIEPTKAIKFE